MPGPNLSTQQLSLALSVVQDRASTNAVVPSSGEVKVDGLHVTSAAPIDRVDSVFWLY